MDELIIKFNANINRIRKANQYFKSNQGSQNAEQQLQGIIDDCNDICNKLESKGFDLKELDMNLT